MIWCAPVCGAVGDFKYKTEDENNIYWQCFHITTHGVKCGHIHVERKDKQELPPQFYDSEEEYHVC